MNKKVRVLTALSFLVIAFTTPLTVLGQVPNNDERNACLDECKATWDQCRKTALDRHTKRIEFCRKTFRASKEKLANCIRRQDELFAQMSAQCTTDFKACMEYCNLRFPRNNE